MMLDDMNLPAGAPAPSNSPRPAEIGTRRDTHPLADREVPVPTGGTALLHQWLDGEVPRAAVTGTGDSESVELWTRINDEAEVLRKRTTPLYVQRRIMDALPSDMYSEPRPWWRRSLSVSAPALVVGAAAAIGIGAVLARLF